MASIFDTIGSDGIMRGILTEMLNGTPTALYPKSHSDNIVYKSSSVEAALNELYQSHSNLGTLLKDTRADLKDYKETVYVKTKIDELLDAIYERLSISFVEMTKLAIAIHGYDSYDKETTDQKLVDVKTPLLTAINDLTVTYNQLANYLTSNYDDHVTQEKKITLLEQRVTDFSDSTREIMYDLLRQFKAEVNDRAFDHFEEYYNKLEIDDMLADRDQMVSVWKGDVELMNMSSAVSIKEHFNDSQNTIIQRNEDAIKSECNNLETKMQSQYDALQSKFDTLMSSLTTINSKVQNETEYPIADEVMF